MSVAAALTLDTVKALTFVVDDLEKSVPAWVHNALSNLLYSAEDEILEAPAPDMETLAWKMNRLSGPMVSEGISATMLREISILRADMDRLLPEPQAESIAA